MQKRNGKYELLHGESMGRKLTEGVQYRGGIFGQPQLPVNRTGLFKKAFALPEQDFFDDSMNPSGIPVRGMIPKVLAGKIAPQEPGSLAVTKKTVRGAATELNGCPGCGGMGDLTAFSAILPLGLILGGLLFLVFTRKK